MCSSDLAYKTGIENILGFHKEGDKLTITPHVPSDWNGFTVRYRFGSSTYVIKYERKETVEPITIDLVDDGQEHLVTL